MKKLRARRDSVRVAAILAELKQAAAGTDNLMPHIPKAVKACATIGEICDVLQSVMGQHENA